jgi:hypothetical protein
MFGAAGKPYYPVACKGGEEAFLAHTPQDVGVQKFGMLEGAT